MPLAVPVKLPDTPLAEVLVEALRANTHEFLNKLHVISGLLQIGETQKAIAFINGVSEDVEDNYQGIIRQLHNRMVAAINAQFAEKTPGVQVDYSTGGRPRVEYRSK